MSVQTTEDPVNLILFHYPVHIIVKAPNNLPYFFYWRQQGVVVVVGNNHYSVNFYHL